MTTQEQQQSPPRAAPQEEHRWLQKLVGDWTYETEAEVEPGKREKFTGTEYVRTLDDIWFLAEGQGETPGGGEATTIMTLGYDPRTKRYVGTFISSNMSYLWLYDGELDATGRVLTLDCEGPRMDGGDGLTRYKDVIEFRSDDHRTLTANVLAADGSWQQLMSVDYRRKK